MYDTNNVFAKILRNELPSTRVFENEYAMLFKTLTHAQKRTFL